MKLHYSISNHTKGYIKSLGFSMEDIWRTDKTHMENTYDTYGEGIVHTTHMWEHTHRRDTSSLRTTHTLLRAHSLYHLSCHSSSYFLEMYASSWFGYFFKDGVLITWFHDLLLFERRWDYCSEFGVWCWSRGVSYMKHGVISVVFIIWEKEGDLGDYLYCVGSIVVWNITYLCKGTHN